MKILVVLFLALSFSCLALENDGKIRVYSDIMEGFPDGTRIVKDNLKSVQGEQILTGDWGKYYEKDGKVMIPISVQAHHSFVDGLHIGQFVEQLQKCLNEC